MANVLSSEKREKIFHLLCEGCGIRSTARLVGCANHSVMLLMNRFTHIVSYLNKINLSDFSSKNIEADEIRTFVKTKKNVRWIYIAMCRKTRMVLHFHIGDRAHDDAKKFLIGLSEKLDERSKISTDCLLSYVSAINDTPENIIDWPKQNLLNLMRARNFGDVLGRSITNRIERANGTIRQHVSRLIRRTSQFSKQEYMLQQHLSLFFFYYNFMKKHSSIRGTPGMEAGLINKPFRMEDLIRYDDIFVQYGAKLGRPTEYSTKYKSAIKYEPKTILDQSAVKRMERYDGVSKAAFIIGYLGAQKGGIVRSMKISPQKRSKIAKKASEVRWAKIVGL